MARSSRSRAKERRQERKKMSRRNQQYIIIGVIAVVAVVLLALLALSNLPSDAPLPETLARYANLEQGVSDEGFPQLGNPDAPVEVKEYASFSCTHCEEFHENEFSELLSRVEAGQIRFVYVPLGTGSVPNAEGANRAALCAGEQGKFWEMHDVLFNWHNVYVNSAFQGNRITTGAAALGLDMSAFDSCFNSSRISDLLTSAQADGVTGTPTFKVNDALVESPTLEAILGAVDSLLSGGTLNTEPEPVEEPTVEATTEATEETEADTTEEAVEATIEATEESD
jgi:protein-disulfide isomerase